METEWATVSNLKKRCLLVQLSLLLNVQLKKGGHRVRVLIRKLLYGLFITLV
uniref:Uncharacterized protein n=1 Tax=viral metagenome TaxID=1070528 RepID=A0A6C0KWZ6_9ZZZZ